MSLPREVKMTRDGGNFWRATIFSQIFTAVVLFPVVLLVIVAILNPFWFRDNFFNWVERSVSKIAQWRNYRTYSLYLGTDPRVWHALKDGKE